MFFGLPEPFMADHVGILVLGDPRSLCQGYLQVPSPKRLRESFRFGFMELFVGRSLGTSAEGFLLLGRPKARIKKPFGWVEEFETVRDETVRDVVGCGAFAS